MYRIFQFFVLALKIDVFIEFLVSLFYFIQFAIEDFQRWDGYVILIVTILILPALYFARATVRLIIYAYQLRAYPYEILHSGGI